MAKRLAGRYGYPEQPHHFDITVHESQFNKLYRWNKPRMVFVCSMGDLFHEDVSENVIKRIFNHFRVYDKHIYQVLTKRPKRMSEFYLQFIQEHCDSEVLDNVWLGVTAENQETANERIPWLLKTPAAVRFVSVEPMLSPVSLKRILLSGTESSTPSGRPPVIIDSLRGWIENMEYPQRARVDWVICGGETGPGAREMKAAWAFNLYQQCREAEIPFFFKKPGDAFTGNKINLPNVRQWPKEDK
jgi:protein gp37